MGSSARSPTPTINSAWILSASYPAVVGVALTFDDGPDPRDTAVVLDELAAVGAPATFFVIAERAAAHPALIGRMLAEGHAVQAHCARHTAHVQMTDGEIAEDIDTVLAVLARIGAPRPRLWRTPFGSWTPATLRLAGERDLQVIGWSLATRDHERSTRAAQTIAGIDAAMPRRILHADSVILMHDCVAQSDRGDNAQTVAMIAPIVARVAASGWELERLDAPISPSRARPDDAVVLLPG
jgi:peptidoglycan/xylan/chitin deacetylase (PgdA/CDA1 family)